MSKKDIIIKSLLGALPGLAVAGVGMGQLVRSHGKAMNLAKSDLVDVKSTVKKHAPEIFVATSEKDIDSVDATDTEKKIFRFVLNHVKDKGNAAYVSNKNMIISPKMLNRGLLGHEIGHSIDIPKGPGKWDTLVRSPLEERAWKESPFYDKGSNDLSEAMVGTYRGADKITLGAPAAIVGGFVPIIMRALKKK